MSLFRYAPATLFAFVGHFAFGQAIDATDANFLRSYCREMAGGYGNPGSWADLSRGAIAHDAEVAIARRIAGSYWKLPLGNGSWLPVPVGEIKVLAVRPLNGRLNNVTLTNASHSWMMMLSWYSPRTEINPEAFAGSVARLKAGFDRIGTFVDCDDPDLTKVSQAIDEMNAVALVASGKSTVYLLGESGVLSKTLERVGSGTEWHALFYPAGDQRGILLASWILGMGASFEAADMPVVLALTEKVEAAPRPDWADRFAEALRTRDAAMMHEIAEANGWRSVPQPKTSRSDK